MTKQEALKAIEDSWSALIVGAPWMSDALRTAKDALRETETDGDLISRQAAIDAVHQSIYKFFDIVGDDSEEQMNDKDKCLLEVNKAVCNEIKALPSAQPDLSGYSDRLWRNAYERGKAEARAERKKGEWIYCDDDDMRYDTYYCSVCGKHFTVDAERFCDIGFVRDDLRYCPNCGARMERGKK